MQGFPLRCRKPLFTSALLWIGSISMASTRDLYGLDLNESRSKIDPFPCAQSHRLPVLFCRILSALPLTTLVLHENLDFFISLNLKRYIIFNYFYFVGEWFPPKVSVSLTYYQHPLSPYCNVYLTSSKLLLRRSLSCFSVGLHITK